MDWSSLLSRNAITTNLSRSQGRGSWGGGGYVPSISKQRKKINFINKGPPHPESVELLWTLSLCLSTSSPDPDSVSNKTISFSTTVFSRSGLWKVYSGCKSIRFFHFSFEKRMTKFAWKFARMFFVVVVVVALRRKYFSSLLWFPWKSISTQNHYGLNIDLFTNQRLNNPIRIRCLLSLTLSPGVIPSGLISSFVMICKLVREQYKDYYSCDLMRLLKVRIGENSPLHFQCLDWKLKQREDSCVTVSLQPRNPDWAVS